MNANDIFLLFVVIAGCIVGFPIIRRINRQTRDARIEDGDAMRRLTPRERIVFARQLSRQQGSWFWAIVWAGIGMVVICFLLLWRFGFIGH